MKAIALRRTKDMQVDGKRLVELPRKTISMHYVDLSPEDREVYDKVEEIGKEVIEGYMRSGTVLQNYATVLQIILRLRQICDHAGLCPAYTEMLTAELNRKGRLFLSSLPCIWDIRCIQTCSQSTDEILDRFWRSLGLV